MQFTTDLLPSDLAGINFYNQKPGEFTFRRGPVFANILLADEINRATPRIQSALLECMEERHNTASDISCKIESVSEKNYAELTELYHKASYSVERCCREELEKAKNIYNIKRVDCHPFLL